MVVIQATFNNIDYIFYIILIKVPVWSSNKITSKVSDQVYSSVWNLVTNQIWIHIKNQLMEDFLNDQ